MSKYCDRVHQICLLYTMNFNLVIAGRCGVRLYPSYFGAGGVEWLEVEISVVRRPMSTGCPH